MQGCSKLFKGGAAKFTCVSMQHVLGSGDVPPGSFFFFFSNHMLRDLFLKPFMGPEYCIFCNLWQAGFRELLHVHIQITSDCRLSTT